MSVENFILKHPKWQHELQILRELALSCQFEEGIKWGMPTYMIEGKNVVGLGAFKHHFSLWFFQGALLKDTHNLLVNAQEDKTQAMRQIKFSSAEQLDSKVLRSYLEEAKKNALEGREVKMVKKAVPDLPQEFTSAFASNPSLKKSFEALTDACKREYIEYISEAKREETRLRRIEKVIPMILEKKGLNDKYK